MSSASDNLIGYHGFHLRTDNVSDLHDIINIFYKKYKKYVNLVQIFLYNPKTYKREILNPNKIDKGIKRIYVHSTFNIVIGKLNYRTFKDQIRYCNEIGAYGFIVHIPLLILDELLVGLTKILDICINIGECKLILEIPAFKKQENVTYCEIKELQKLCEKLDSLNKGKYIGKYSICIDTAHLWSYGYDLRSVRSAKKYCNDMLKIIDHIDCVHFNGNKLELGNGRDMHEIPCNDNDKIWHGDGCKSFEYMYSFLICNKIDIVFELNIGDDEIYKKFIAKLKNIKIK